MQGVKTQNTVPAFFEIAFTKRSLPGRGREKRYYGEPVLACARFPGTGLERTYYYWTRTLVLEKSTRLQTKEPESTEESNLVITKEARYYA